MKIERPAFTPRCDEVKKYLIPKLASRVEKWFGNDYSFEEIKEILTKAMGGCYDCGGYALAKRLDEYNPDAELVEILDDTASLVRDILDKLQTEWVKTSGLIPPVVNSVVKFCHFGKDFTGTVTSNRETGHSIINCEELGHWPIGKPFEASRCVTGVLVPWEDIES